MPYAEKLHLTTDPTIAVIQDWYFNVAIWGFDKKIYYSYYFF